MQMLMIREHGQLYIQSVNKLYNLFNQIGGIMSRPYFKNDLFMYATQKGRQKDLQVKKALQQKKQKQAQAKKTKSKRNADNEQNAHGKIKLFDNIAVDDTLTLSLDKKAIIPMMQQDEGYSEMCKSLSKKKPTTQLEQKNVVASSYKPKCSLVVKQQPKTAQRTQDEEKNDRIKKHVGFRKVEDEIKKAIFEGKNGQKKQEEQKEKNSQDESKQESEGKIKTKRIKKQSNYIKLDLKRKYKDRFLGGINNNLRRFTKNGRLRPKFRAQSQLVMDQGQLYNSYVSSLSKALVVSIPLQDDSDGISEQSNSKKWVQPEEWNRQTLTKIIQDYFGFEDFREGQFQTITNILNGVSTLFVSQTASGKSLTYIISSMLMKGLSIVISPLVSLMLDQLAHLPDDLPAACISSLINRQQRDRIIGLVKAGKIHLLFITPECLQTDFIYHLLAFPEVNFTCIDEAHSLSELSHNFRTSFLALGDIVLNLIKYKGKKPTILALTATANPQSVQSIKQKLDIHQLIRSSRCMNKNLFVTVSRQKSGLKYDSLIQYLNNPVINDCKGILVYTRTRKIMFQVFNYITNSVNSVVAIYHGALSSKQKEETLQKFRSGQIKIVVATVALGMGLDFSNLQCVVHINLPKSIENYVQEIGRAGRRQRRAYCHLFLDDNDYITQRNYIIADDIQPTILGIIYKSLRQNSVLKVNKNISKHLIQIEQNQVIKRATILMDQAVRTQKIIYQEEEEQYESNQEIENIPIQKPKLKSRFFSMRVEKITQLTQLRQEAILTLLLKIQNMLKTDEQVRFKVFPISNQVIKLGFFKDNENIIKQQVPFFNSLVCDCKRNRGTVYINLIEKCNKLQMKPIQLLTQLYRISNQYAVQIVLQFPIFVWQFEGPRLQLEQGIEEELGRLVQKGFDRLESPECIKQIVDKMSNIQKTSLIKLNTFYSLAFLNARTTLTSIIQNNLIINRTKPIPTESIAKQFDQYFKSGLFEYYDKITTHGRDIYVPTSIVDEHDKSEIYSCIVLFFKQELRNKGDLMNDFEIIKCRKELFKEYADGKAITKILMGVNYRDVSWKIYGDRNYWMAFKSKNYEELLENVQQQLAAYKIAYQI